MFDLIGDLLDVLVSNGVPGAQRLSAQRPARAAASGVGAGMVVAAGAWHSSPATAAVLLGGVAISAWVLGFSLTDIVKERPAVPWWSVIASVVSGVSLLAGIRVLVHWSGMAA